MRKLMLIFGTRPEAIKMAPLVQEMRRRGTFDVHVTVTGQHREMLTSVLETFGIVPDTSLDLLSPGQTLDALHTRILAETGRVMDAERPDAVLVHGDTTTALASSLAAFYRGIPVCHVEAGLRTYRTDAPFPEESNRHAIDTVSALCFAPTEDAAANLRREGKSEDAVFVTGNTGIDALSWSMKQKAPDLPEIPDGKRLVLLTAHRRENLASLEALLRAIRAVIEEMPDVFCIYPVHRNPAVREAANRAFAGCRDVMLKEPMPLVPFQHLLSRAYVALTDSGGLQEEAPALGVPVLVMRDFTERPEGVRAGSIRLVGTSPTSVAAALREMLRDESMHREMSRVSFPFGEGGASARIADILEARFPEI